MAFMMVITSWTALVSHPLEDEQKPSSVQTYLPQGNVTGVSLTQNNALTLPYNETFLSGNLSVTPEWLDDKDSSTSFGIDSGNSWSGTHNGTQGIGRGGQLSLASQQSIATLTDFETLVETAVGWRGTGLHHSVWGIAQPGSWTSNSSHSLPVSSPSGQNVVGTVHPRDLQASMTGCLISPSYSIPGFVKNYTLSIDQWLALDDTDAAWMEWRTSSQNAWQHLVPVGGYSNVSGLSDTPSDVWSGQSGQWISSQFSLDSILPNGASTFEFRLCFQTSATPSPRGGWFLDNMNLSNEGDLPGVWFHGNLTGSYEPDAYGILRVGANLSGMTGPLDLEFWANWDLEGSFNDNMQTFLSLDNGTTWQLLSGLPGLPGNGFNWQGTYYMDESNRWVPLVYSLPANASSHVNASNALLEFVVLTSSQVGFGGSGSSGWEGIMIDDISIYSNLGTALEQKRLVANFSTQPSGTIGSSEGWLPPPNGDTNEWQWNDEYGMNGASFDTDSFESTLTTPSGWYVEGTGVQAWEIGQTRNTSGYGPGAFHSGLNGAAINLTTRYQPNIYTHLVSPEYVVPDNATARLTFRSWVCTEADWDGGAVSISTDGGDSWWFLPVDTTSFHDQISTPNTNSPFFGEGILDGSNVAGGCGGNKAPRGFDLKTKDLSNLSGTTVRARFSFFSDSYIEADGWYIDDAGIEVDVFESAGSWTSPALYPDENYGYGLVDGWAYVPDDTGMVFDVLDASGDVIPGHNGLVLPFHLAVDPVEHPTVQIRVSMSTLDVLVTPLIHSLTVGSTVYFSPQYLQSITPGFQQLVLTSEGFLEVNGTLGLDLPSIALCPHSGYRLTTYGDNLTWTNPRAQLVSSSYAGVNGGLNHFNMSYIGSPELVHSLRVDANGGEVFRRAKMTLDCVSPPNSPQLQIGLNNLSLWQWSETGASPSFGMNHQFSDAHYDQLQWQWNATQPSPSIQVNSIPYRLNYTAIVPTAVTTSSIPTTALYLLITNTSGTVDLLINGAVQTTVSGPTGYLYTSNQTCPNRVIQRPYTANLDLVTCQLSILLQGQGDLKVIDFQHMYVAQTYDIEIPGTILNEAKQASFTGDMREILDIPLHVSTQSGGITVDLDAQTSPLMIESVEEMQHTRWLPGESITIVTHHQRINPLDLSEDASDFDHIELLLSRTDNAADAFVHAKVERFDTTPRFLHLNGAGLAPINISNSQASCVVNSCSITWVFTSTWLLDDVDDLYVLTYGTDTDGLQAGPAVSVRKTNFNEVENDMEIIQFEVTDDQSRRLDDWTNPLWPYHLSNNRSMIAEGRIRMEGISNQWISEGEAEIQIFIQTIPPRNESGGPDEWTGSPINWSQNWTTDVGPDGRFSLPLNSPQLSDELPSNTWFQIKPTISRTGPMSIPASTSEDRTVIINPVRFLFDIASPTVTSLTILDSGNEVLADGHVWTNGQDIPIRLSVIDIEGVSSQLSVFSWMEARDDSNNDGVMDTSEYKQENVSLNIGRTELEVDLPLLSWTDAVGFASDTGRVSIVLESEDLGGNFLEGGGSFGEANDLATFTVQRRYDTLMDIESITMDFENDSLFAGKEHTFSFDISDGNGLGSLEDIRFALLGRDQPNDCNVHYEPRFGEIIYDDVCFMEEPTISVTQRPLTSIFQIEIKFRLEWNATFDLMEEGGTPSLKIIDEGNDLRLGLSKINRLSWAPSNTLEMRWLNINDTTLPVGSNNETSHWFHRNDRVHHEIGMFHAGTNHLAEFLPEQGQLFWQLSDGERKESGNITHSTNGLFSFEAMMDENTLYHDYGELRVDVLGFSDYNLTPLEYQVIVDDLSPQLTLAPGSLQGITSDALQAVPLMLMVSDDTHMSPEPLVLHHVFYRMGEEVAGSKGQSLVPLNLSLNTKFIYESTLNLKPNGVELQRSDLLVVWFEGEDRSGRPLVGLGTSDDPLRIGITWVAFEPTFTDISALPFRPSVGENISVFVRIANNGLLDGNLTIHLRDDEGTLHQTEFLSLSRGEWSNFVWEVEAWKTGRLGLTVEIENMTPRIPVPLADIQSGEPENPQGEMALFSLSLLSVVLAGLVLFVTRQRWEEREEVYQRAKIRRIVFGTRPPPRPPELMDTSREE